MIFVESMCSIDKIVGALGGSLWRVEHSTDVKQQLTKKWHLVVVDALLF